MFNRTATDRERLARRVLTLHRQTVRTSNAFETEERGVIKVQKLTRYLKARQQAETFIDDHVLSVVDNIPTNEAQRLKKLLIAGKGNGTVATILYATYLYLRTGRVSGDIGECVT